jgi:hypothetical protein
VVRPLQEARADRHEIAADYGGRLKVVKVDRGTPRRHPRPSSGALGSTLLFFSGGPVKDQYVGVLSKKALADRVDKVL